MILACALAAGLFAPPLASAAPTHVTVAFYNAYWPKPLDADPVVEIHAGDRLQLANLDPFGLFFFWPDHTITEEVVDEIRPPRFDSGAVPIGDVRPVTGVEDLAPGEYPFYCNTHGPVMRGTLVVTP